VVDDKGAPVAADLEVEYENQEGAESGRAGADGRFELTWRHPRSAACARAAANRRSGVAFSDVLEKVPADLRLVCASGRRAPGAARCAPPRSGARLAEFRAYASWEGNDVPDGLPLAAVRRDSRPARDGCACLAPPNDAPQSGRGDGRRAGPCDDRREVEWKPGADGATGSSGD